MDGKILYTIYSMKPEGHAGPLFEIAPVGEGRHCVDLWNHQEVEPVNRDGKTLVPVTVAPFDRSFLNTRQEGNVVCIAILPEVMKLTFKPDTLYFSSSEGDVVVITPGNPAYNVKAFRFPAKEGSFAYWDNIPETTEKLVVQLFGDDQLLDERVFYPVRNLPRLVSRINRTLPDGNSTKAMTEVPSGNFRFYTIA